MIENLLKNKINKEDYDLGIKEPKYFYMGNPVPRVTEIISKTIAEEYIILWANSLGFRRMKYKAELQKASDAGTAGHNAIEDYLTNGNIIENFPLKSFMVWWNNLNANHIVEVVSMETPLSCPWFGGTYDLILRIDGKLYLIDFKTSNHVSYKYFLQLSAYMYMQPGTIFDGCIILQLDKNEIAFEEYFIDLYNNDHLLFMNHCLTTFLSMTYTYYNTIKAKQMYDAIFQQ